MTNISLQKYTPEVQELIKEKIWESQLRNSVTVEEIEEDEESEKWAKIIKKKAYKALKKENPSKVAWIKDEDSDYEYYEYFDSDDQDTVRRAAEEGKKTVTVGDQTLDLSESCHKFELEESNVSYTLRVDKALKREVRKIIKEAKGN